jgi:hypothetical protein
VFDSGGIFGFVSLSYSLLFFVLPFFLLFVGFVAFPSSR